MEHRKREREGDGVDKSQQRSEVKRKQRRSTTADDRLSLFVLFYFQFSVVNFSPVLDRGPLNCCFRSMALLTDLLSDPRYAVAALVLLATVLILLKSSSSSSRSDDDAILDPTAAAKPLRTFTLAQVAEHASKEDAWIVIDGGVYDITPYVTEHPGGVKAILKNAGGDATKGFKGPQHPARVFDMIDDYKIGTIADSPGS